MGAAIEAANIRRPTEDDKVLLLDTDVNRRKYADGVGKVHTIEHDAHDDEPYILSGCRSWFREDDVKREVSVALAEATSQEERPPEKVAFGAVVEEAVAARIETIFAEQRASLQYDARIKTRKAFAEQRASLQSEAA